MNRYSAFFAITAVMTAATILVWAEVNEYREKLTIEEQPETTALFSPINRL
jgi:uncharacterized membrane protein YjfL (UPF0719 family)